MGYYNEQDEDKDKEEKEDKMVLLLGSGRQGPNSIWSRPSLWLLQNAFFIVTPTWLPRLESRANTMPPAAGKGGEIPRDESDDPSWVRVEPRSRRGTRRPQAPAIKPAPARTVHVRPVSEIDAEYQRIRAQWLESTAHTRLCQIVDAIACSNVTRAVCLGIGSFDPPDGAWEAKKTAFVQFIAFKTIVDQLGVLLFPSSQFPPFSSLLRGDLPDKEEGRK